VSPELATGGGGGKRYGVGSSHICVRNGPGKKPRPFCLYGAAPGSHVSGGPVLQPDPTDFVCPPCLFYWGLETTQTMG
jgi:hypothetical protein